MLCSPLDVITTLGFLLTRLDIEHDLFHIGRKLPHHFRSERKLVLSLILWCNSLMPFDSSIILLRNDPPCFMMQQACWSWPMIDKSSLFVHHFMVWYR